MRTFLSLMLLAVSCVAALAKPAPFIDLILETREAFIGDTVVLEVRWSGLLDEPDLSVLQKRADFVRQTSGTRLAVVEGQVIDISSRRIELKPQATGLLIFGPVEAEGVSSNTVSINVVEARSLVWTPDENDIRLSQTVSEQTPWLQQQVTIDIRLMTRHPVLDEVAILPKFGDFRVVELFRERRTLEEADGGWAVTAWRYLLFPQRSGRIAIPGARIAGKLVKSRAERAAFELVADATDLDVKASAFPPQTWWLAAQSLSLHDDWSKDPTTLSAGDEVERVITVSARGVLPEQIPEVTMPETRGLAATPLTVERQSRIVDGMAEATARFHFRVRAISPVPVFLDTVRLRWWNVASNSAADALIPARRIDIALPEQAALSRNARAQQSWLDRLMMQAVAYRQLSVIGVFALVCLIVALAWRRQKVNSLQNVEMNELKRLGKRGDAKAFHACLRRISLREPLLSPLIGEFEQVSAKAGQPDMRSIAARAQAILRMRPDMRSGLPPL